MSKEQKQANKMSGLKRLCRMYGQMDVVGENGEKVVWVWDYANEKPMLKTEMTKEQWAESEKAKWTKAINK